MRSSSSELLPDESDPSMFTLPSELDTTILSAFAIVDHSELELLVIDSELLEKWRPFFLLGMFIALPPMVGDESGEDCSAKVEWWRFVAAREKSRPLDLLGRTLEGEPYVCEWSSFGDKGARLIYAWVLGDIRSRAGICRERPRSGKAGRRGVVGLSLSALSSWAFFFSGSRNLGDGES